MKKVRFLPLILCLLLMAGIFTGCATGSAVTPGTSPSGSPDPSGNNFEDRQPTMANSYDEIYEALTTIQTNWNGTARDEGFGVSAPMDQPTAETSTAPMPAEDTDGAKYGDNGDYSQTNVQVQGVDEGDIVKTDGSYIYVLRDNELIIFRADGAATVKVSSVRIAESGSSGKLAVSGTPAAGSAEPNVTRSVREYASDLYVSGDTAAVITSYSSYALYADDDADDEKAEIIPPAENKQIAKVHIIDITDRTKPVEQADLGQDGSVLSSRLVGTTLYLISNYYVYDIQEGDNGTFVPRLYAGSTETAMSAGSIAIMPYIRSTSYTVVCSYDLENAAQGESQSILGGGTTVYMNTAALYIAGSTSSQTESEPYQDSIYTVIDYTTTNVTDITRFDLSGGRLTLAASGTVPGSLYSQFAMDEYEGSLRVATTTYSQSWSEYKDEDKGFVNYVWEDSESANALYVLNGELQTVGSIGDLAPDEQVQSVRFDGAIGYIVTFRRVDPLFAVDLSDPENPAVLSALKIPGFSQYLHVWDDGRLFGLGMDADEETGRTDGMKLSMFDTSDPTNVTEKQTLKLDTSWSNALYNHKAILISYEKNIIAFPAEDGYDIYSYTDEQGFRQMAHIDSVNWGGDARGLYIGDYAYIVDSAFIAVLDMDGLKLVDKISY